MAANAADQADGAPWSIDAEMQKLGFVGSLLDDMPLKEMLKAFEQADAVGWLFQAPVVWTTRSGDRQHARVLIEAAISFRRAYREARDYALTKPPGGL